MSNQDSVTVDKSQSYVLTIKNPCIDPNFVEIVLLTAFTDFDYPVSKTEQSITHGVFEIQTDPIDHSLCGTITLTPTCGGVAVDDDPCFYVEASRKFDIFTEDFALAGTSIKYRVDAALTGYGSNAAASTTFGEADLNFIDPCLSPFSFSTTAQTNPSAYGYDDVNLDFVLTEFSITPSVCEITYACTQVSRVDGTASDLACDDFNLDGTFDSSGTDGELKFNTTPSQQDYIDQNVAPGAYTIQITGTATTSSQTKVVSITLTLTDLCSQPTLSLPTSPALADQSYTVSDPS